MSTSPMALLEGGPDGLEQRIVPITPPGIELRVAFGGGYERFKVTPRWQDTPEGSLPVYEWVAHIEAKK
ncbi:DUF5988 family protein [Nocardia seriolae]|uniref:Uncharacterized protein n=2 Tax=Nocardia seriolae TaxID=37332 RepID=A0ABC8ALH1_9NOCA|nr:DUF5988 family protein [Nocardia seriolae]APA94877.1 hypothetical protein NS506_00798 [Nocardia seriolae]MTJ60169.1 hypothetical protein [Nocardia seriolae]MTJ71780.1 hypothetical protein [Nocardia seriolae]MTJ85165.1 hypothetical protein [Nocardia seriolae]MTK29160.1 hypothetical protein [Nocardia seriolae]